MNYQPPMEPFLDVIYVDDDVLVLNKPSGLLSVPGRQLKHKDSLQSRAQQQFPTATTVHRLDMETSGLILMALNKHSHVNLSRQFEHRQIEKSYLARVFGYVADDNGQVDTPLICDWPNRPKQMIDHNNGKAALTQWQVLEREPMTSLLKLKPITGRSHQLRVHMMSIGHPIIGDSLYADGEALTLASRLALQSQAISFRAPANDNVMQFKLSSDF